MTNYYLTIHEMAQKVRESEFKTTVKVKHETKYHVSNVDEYILISPETWTFLISTHDIYEACIVFAKGRNELK